MSTLSFQDYVRERMLKKREAERGAAAAAQPEAARQAAHAAHAARTVLPPAGPRADPARRRSLRRARRLRPGSGSRRPPPRPRHAERAALDEGPDRGALRRARLHGEAAAQPEAGPPHAEAARLRLLARLDPQARRGPAADMADETPWASGVLERNLYDRRIRARAGRPGGVYALVGATGVGKTTTTAKVAAAFATKYGAAQPRPRHARRLSRRRPRAAARLRPHPRRAGAHRARPRVARGPARAAGGQEDGADRHRRHGAARQPHARAARHAVAPLDPEAAGRQRRRPGRDDRRRDDRRTAPPRAAASCCPSSTRP